jgi:hypothetical protein
MHPIQDLFLESFFYMNYNLICIFYMHSYLHKILFLKKSGCYNTIRCAWMPVALSYHARHSMLLSPEDPAPVPLLGTDSPRVRLPGAWVHFELGHEEGLQWADGW